MGASATSRPATLPDDHIVEYEQAREHLTNEEKIWNPLIEKQLTAAVSEKGHLTVAELKSYIQKMYNINKVIKFNDLKNLGFIPRLGYGLPPKSFPNAPNDANDLVKLLDNIDRSRAFLVFISHTWIAGSDSSPEWRGYPHVDTKDNAKFKLQIEGVEQLWKTMAPEMAECYVWQDYTCLDQNSWNADEFQPNQLVGLFDCIFTPVLDHTGTTFDVWVPSKNGSDVFTELHLQAFNKGPSAYLNRPWCRLEMLCAGFIPCPLDNQARAPKFSSDLKIAIEKDMRPHFVYSSKESLELEPPILMPALQNTAFKRFAPEKVMKNLSNPSDTDVIRRLLEQVTSHVQKSVAFEGYIGPFNAQGLKHGRGLYSWSNGTVYDGNFIEGKRTGKGVLTSSRGNVFSGDFIDSKMDGHGIFTYPCGNVYDGQFADDKMNGIGTYTFRNGNVYNGEFHRDKMHGNGRMTFPNGDVYVGDSVDDRRTGKGVLTLASGNSYTGDFVDGKMHGHGIFTFISGDVYEGAFKHQLRTGNGVLTELAGNVYTGQFLDGKRHGIGLHRFSNEDQYEGDFVDNKMQGRGVYNYATGDIYEGDIIDARYDGQGTITFTNGNVYEGAFKNNKMHGSGVFRYANGDVYDGDFKAGAMHGEGTFTYINGNVYTGEFCKGEKHGEGEFTYVSGDVYQGSYENEQRTGYGEYVFASGDTYEGDFEDGNYHGEGMYTYANGKVWHDGEWRNDKPVDKL